MQRRNMPSLLLFQLGLLSSPLPSFDDLLSAVADRCACTATDVRAQSAVTSWSSAWAWGKFHLKFIDVPFAAEKGVRLLQQPSRPEVL